MADRIIENFSKSIGRITAQEIYAQREEILEAFIAKYNCNPDEIEQVIQTEYNKVIWYLRKRITLKLRENTNG